jgi:hypothetical protein
VIAVTRIQYTTRVANGTDCIIGGIETYTFLLTVEFSQQDLIQSRRSIREGIEDLLLEMAKIQVDNSDLVQRLNEWVTTNQTLLVA